MMKKITSLIFSLFILASTGVVEAASQQQTLTWSGRLTYNDLLGDHQTKLSDYYARIRRGTRTYRSNLHTGLYYTITRTDDHWQPKYAQETNYVFRYIRAKNTNDSFWHLINNDQAESRVIFRLDDEQLDFANLYFNFSNIYTTTAQGVRLPILSVDVCGQTNWLTLDDGDYTRDQEILLPNPGCDSEHRTIEWHLVDQALDNGAFYDVRIYKISFRVIKRASSEIINFARVDGQPFAYVENGDWVCQAEKCYLEQTDLYHTRSENVDVGDVDADGEILSTARWSYYELPDHARLENNVVDIKQITWESDDSLSLSVVRPSFSWSNLQSGLTLGVSRDLAALRGNWDQVTRIDENGRDNYHGLRFVSQRHSWEIANFSLADIDTGEALYVAARWRSYYDEYGPLSAIYRCQQQTCTLIGDLPALPVARLHRVVFPDSEEHGARVEVAVRSGVTLKNLRVSEGLEAGVNLATGTTTGETTDGWQIVSLEWPDLVPDHIWLQLYLDGQEEPLDRLDTSLSMLADEPTLSLVRDELTLQWKEAYVRN